MFFFFFQAEAGIRDIGVTGVQTCALPISATIRRAGYADRRRPPLHHPTELDRLQLFLLGAGHVGLVTAVGLARLQHHVTVGDVDRERIDGLQSGRPPIYEPGLDAAVRDLGAAGRLRFTADLTPPPDAAMTFVCVNTPTGPEGPLSTVNVERAVAGVLDACGANHVVVIRSTLPVDGPARLRA